jgi:hypothetical protein
MAECRHCHRWSLSGCELGNYASYSINVTDAAHDIAADIAFARNNHVRLGIKTQVLSTSPLTICHSLVAIVTIIFCLFILSIFLPSLSSSFLTIWLVIS